MIAVHPSFLTPTLEDGPLAFFRCAAGALLLGQLAWTLPHARRYFLGKRWGGYGQSSPFVALGHHPWLCPVVMLLWAASATGLTLGCWTVPAAFINVVLCRYFFVQMRWRGLLRGMGAPGFMTYWTACAVLLLELTRQHAPDVKSMALLVLQVDFALIMFTAGLAKLGAGYWHNQGMEFGLANPQWGRWPQVFQKLPPHHRFFRVANHLAWSGEIAAAVLLLVPATRTLGVALLIASFLFIAVSIRLQFLPWMVMLVGVLYCQPGTLGAEVLAGANVLTPAAAGPGLLLNGWQSAVLATILWGYLVLLPLTYAGLLRNFYIRRTLPARLQAALDWYTNWCGIQLWRVFSADHTHFFIQIYRVGRRGERNLLSRWGAGRFAQVAEAITVTNLFMTLKYRPRDVQLFTDRLLHYAGTLPGAPDGLFIFEYVALQKTGEGFAAAPGAEFVVDVARGKVDEHALDGQVDPRSPLPCSPIHETTAAGSYAPARA